MFSNNDKVLSKLWRQWSITSYSMNELVASRRIVHAQSTNNIVRLDLSCCKLQGDLAPEMGELSHLIVLVLSGNYLTAIPKEIGKLSCLMTLDVGWNQLTSLPSEIGNLTCLSQLEASNNRLTNIPVEIANLQYLWYLNLMNNELENLPLEVLDMTSLKNLYLDNNCLVNVPTSEKVSIFAHDQRPCVNNFSILFRDEEAQDEKSSILVNSDYLAKKWKFLMHLLNSGCREVQLGEMDLSDFLSIRSGKCLIDTFYRLNTDFRILEPKDCIDIVLHTSELRFNTNSDLFKYAQKVTSQLGLK